MLCKFQVNFALFLVAILGSKISSAHEFMVVSTTQRPNTVEEKSEKCDESKFQSQISQIKETLENRLALVEAIVIKLQAKDDQLSEIKEALEKEKKLNEEINRKLQATEKQISEIHNTNKYHGNNSASKPLPKDCEELKQQGNHISGIYLIQPKSEAFMVMCEMNISGGGWTVFQNRFDGKQDFQQYWLQYEQGFGNLLGEYWLGLNHLYQLTGHESSQLLIELTDFQEKTVHAYYDTFKIGSEKEGYSIKLLEGFSGDAGDSLSYHKGMKFSTKDHDQDASAGLNCADQYTGAWWHNACLWSNLNGRYLGAIVANTDYHSGMFWATYRGPGYSLKRARMMVRSNV